MQEKERNITNLEANMKMNNIYIDIDMGFDLFEKSRTKELIVKNLPIIREKWGQFTIFKRKSSSGNVHLKLFFLRDIPVLEQFEIRSLMHDDIYRIGIDLRRLVIQGESEINRIFKAKYKNGLKYEVGPWLVWRVIEK